MTITGSIYAVLIIAVERERAILHPLKVKKTNEKMWTIFNLLKTNYLPYLINKVQRRSEEESYRKVWDSSPPLGNLNFNALVENILNTWHVSLSSTCETESKVAKNVFCHIWCKLWGGSVEKSSGKVQDPSPSLENLNFSIIWNTWHVPLSSTWTISDSKCNFVLQILWPFHFDWDRCLIQILAW